MGKHEREPIKQVGKLYKRFLMKQMIVDAKNSGKFFKEGSALIEEALKD